LLGLDLSFAHHELLLPIGISFYTFQTLSYTIDLYRRRIPVERNLLRFAVYVSFFPQLVAGPIVRASHFLPQLRSAPRVDRERFCGGLALVFQGLFKKIVIADLLAELGVDAVFARPDAYSSWDLLLALYGYAYQIYNDFSGYSDIAIGTARMLGFNIPDNFDRPYLSQNLREFWTRWHISLSTWLRDYLYISLGGNRRRPLRVRFNLLATRVLGGLWHGAAFNFVLWGAYHGLLLVVYRLLERVLPEDGGGSRARPFVQTVLFFHLVAFGWIIFRAESLAHLGALLHALLFSFHVTLDPATLLLVKKVALFGSIPLLYQFFQYIGEDPFPARRFVLPLRTAFYVVLFYAITIFGYSDAQSFVYFQF
jgi:D-alanyl-lipoteichoic acid acyltransferase DltB (MBOAT superfamily)